MSLAEDYNMYYGGTYVGLADNNGVVRPFWVTGVTRGRDFTNHDYSEDAIRALKFSGTFFGSNGPEDKTVSYPKLVLEMPDLGYVSFGGRDYYLTWKPSRSTKKGLCDRRIAGVGRLDNVFVQSIFESVNKNPDPLSRQFLIKDGKVAYKGYLVGTVDNQLIKIGKKFKYVLPYLRKILQEGFVAQEEV